MLSIVYFFLSISQELYSSKKVSRNYDVFLASFNDYSNILLSIFEIYFKNHQMKRDLIEKVITLKIPNDLKGQKL